jgi:hypothetical protein
MARQGYAYYVYVCPGVIEYFREDQKKEAEEYAEQNDSTVEEMF